MGMLKTYKLLLCIGAGLMLGACSSSSYSGMQLTEADFKNMFRDHTWYMSTIHAVYADGTYGMEDLRAHWVGGYVGVNFVCDNDSLYEYKGCFIAGLHTFEYYRPGTTYEYDAKSHTLSLKNLELSRYEKLRELEVVYISKDSMLCFSPIIDNVRKDSLAVKSLITFKAKDIPSDFRDMILDEKSANEKINQLNEYE